MHQAGELTISLFDWNMTGGEELVGKAILKSSQVTKLLCGQRGKTVKLNLTLQVTSRVKTGRKNREN